MKKIAFVSTNKSSWGGSEYLWYYTALKFSKEGYEVIVSIPRWKEIPKDIIELQKKNIKVHFNTDILGYKKLINRFVPSSLQFDYKNDGYKFLLQFRPDLVVISQGGNTGGINLMDFCIENNLRFITISQAANEAKWPTDELNKKLSNAFPKAIRNYFVSKANMQLTEIQICRKIENSKIVFNPFNVEYDNDIEYPVSGENYFLANVARHEFFAKGQDILFQVLNEKKWRDRNLFVNLYGKGEHSFSINKLKSYFNLDKVNIAGHVNPLEIWKQNHALVLTSRYEGLPLALVEAMLCGRTCIVTDVSGNPEIIIDNVNGFLAKAPKVEFVDEALERAWCRRTEWKELGVKAKEYIRTIIPRDPVEYFYNEIKNLKL
ncbi:MAG: glycosyltransferase [Bacteroidota bacterium]|nr:glycosyltransferase [Bacteroidota bacterium]